MVVWVGFRPGIQGPAAITSWCFPHGQPAMDGELGFQSGSDFKVLAVLTEGAPPLLKSWKIVCPAKIGGFLDGGLEGWCVTNLTHMPTLWSWYHMVPILHTLPRGLQQHVQRHTAGKWQCQDSDQSPPCFPLYSMPLFLKKTGDSRKEKKSSSVRWDIVMELLCELRRSMLIIIIIYWTLTVCLSLCSKWLICVSY